jgi:8-oxo-dGTP pyrophosphatase MutT (NUDIX family)
MAIVGAHVLFHRTLKTTQKGVTPEQFVLAVLLCKRTLDAPVHPGHWGLFGGKLDPGEKPEEAAVREVQEELHLHLEGNDLKLLCDVQVHRGSESPSVRYYSHFLNCDLDGLTLQRSPKGKVEGEGLGWFSEEEIHHATIRPEDRIAIDTFLERQMTPQIAVD